MTFGARSAIFSASKPGCTVRMASICSPTRLSLSLRTTLSSLRTSLAPGISLRSSPISLSLSIKPVRSNFKNLVSASSASADMAGQCQKKVEKFQTEEEVAVRLAKYTADLSAKFVKERGAFTVVLSGGSLIYTLRWLSGDSIGVVRVGTRPVDLKISTWYQSQEAGPYCHMIGRDWIVTKLVANLAFTFG